MVERVFNLLPVQGAALSVQAAAVGGPRAVITPGILIQPSSTAVTETANSINWLTVAR